MCVKSMAEAERTTETEHRYAVCCFRTLACPLVAAPCSAVQPDPVTASTSAPQRSSTSAAAVQPPEAAQYSAGAPEDMLRAGRNRASS